MTEALREFGGTEGFRSQSIRVADSWQITASRFRTPVPRLQIDRTDGRLT
jgi:hypothetical protein